MEGRKNAPVPDRSRLRESLTVISIMTAGIMPCNGIVEERRRYNGSIPCRENKGLYDNEQSPSAQYGVVLKGKGAFITYVVAAGRLGLYHERTRPYLQRTMPKVGRNSMKRLTYKDPGANTIEVSGRIRSFERYARKHQVRYHIEKELGTDPPKWTVYFKANQADALTAAFKEYTKKDLTRSTRPSLLIQLHKFKELAQSLGRDRVKNKEHGGPER